VAALRAAIAAMALVAGSAFAQPPAEPSVSLESMAAPALVPGQCALFLWSRAPGQRDRALVAVVAEARPAFVRVQIGGRVLDIPAAQGAGTAASAIQFAKPPYGVAIRLAPGAGEVRNGLVRLTGPRGWEAITPVSGRRVCASG
jgi:hypothetical protein